MIYTTNQYLLDRVFISDTIHSLWLNFDLGLSKEAFTSRLVNTVFASQVHVDYTVLFGGGQPVDIGSAEQAEQWHGFMSSLDGYLHHTGPVVPSDLPVPDGVVQRPERATMLSKAMTVLQKGEATTGNGAVMELGLVRLKGSEGNAWRIERMRVLRKAYETGDPKAVFT